MDPKEIAKIVRSHRKQSGLSQQKLAQLAGVGKSVIFDIEKGEKETIQLNTLLKVFEVLNIKLKLVTPNAPWDKVIKFEYKLPPIPKTKDKT